jgi:hypothetical protein
MYQYILCVVIVSGALVALLPPDPRRPRPWSGAADTIRQEQADALLTYRLERGGGIQVPMELVPSVLGGMICSQSLTSVAC